MHLMKRELGSRVVWLKRQHEDAPVSRSNLSNFTRCDTGSLSDSAQTSLGP